MKKLFASDSGFYNQPANCYFSSMKIKHAIFIFVLGFIIKMSGSWMVLTHHEYARNVVFAGILFMIAASIIFLWRILKNPKYKDFLNK